MSKVALEIVLIVLMVLANGVFAMSEMAVVSARSARLQRLAEAGNAGARAALELIESPNRFLSTVQIGITLIGILAGAFGGATIAQELAISLSEVPLIGPYSEAIGVAIVVLGTTYLSLVIGELAPKRLALNNAEGIASRIARPMQVLAKLAAPAVRLLTISTEAVVRLVGAKPSPEPPITEEEINILMEQGARTGVFEPVEHDIVERVLDLDQRRVGSVMTPYIEIDWLDIDAPQETNWHKLASSGRSYFPVCKGSLDRPVGVVSVKSIWTAMFKGQDTDLQSLMQPALYVPENAFVLSLLQTLRESGQYMVLVLGEHGGIEGLVTLKDIMEAIVGGFPSPEDRSAESEMVQRPDGSWLVDGLLALDEFEMKFDLEDKLRSECKGEYLTVGGFVMACLGRIPSETDGFERQGYRFEVVDMDEHRVDKVLVTPVQEKSHEAPQ
nr:HlyC/CorC family transporter [Anaerolineae bacterium]